MRRAEPGPGSIGTGPLRAGPLELDPRRHEANVGGQPLELTPTEYRILESLLDRVIADPELNDRPTLLALAQATLSEE